ncbi:PLP-dependent aminotransferase family protein [Roseomonas eburnea]|uniref:PLP-dependent aminotransferase family protein n=2 Tax=Neoroseomonas eburnea TaxID=1346889 RepID=A0A9X9X858_9PROT|nr:PLP-dependent aminotransferase family protein [Neoroseomonas eburnea]MBR0679894.1 PLP-dependent aminotransferase family protein [Neoroseomonas eburnea]
MHLDRAADMPLYQQVAAHLRDRILDGGLPAGSRLIGSREIARELGCSRVIVLAALELLYAEGYLLSVPRGGVRVAALGRKVAPDAPPPRADIEPSRLSHRWRSVLAIDYAFDLASPFSTGTPDIADFPFDTWARLLRQAWRHAPRSACTDMSPLGWRPLREATAEFLGTVRGLLCRPEEVVITPASAGALDLCCRMLIDPGDEVWVEEPGFIEARWALQAAGARLVPVPVDSKGLVVAEGVRRAPRAKLAVVTPSHQFPLGVAMSLDRRLELLDWAQAQGAWIIEDDYNSEFRHRDSMAASLKSLDRAGHVIYLGTFSKVMLPSLRIGYLVASTAFVEAFGRGRARIDVHTAGTAQPALAEFLREGHLLRYLRRMRPVYAARKQAVLDALQALLPEELEVAPSGAGLHLTGLFTPRLAARLTDREASARSRRAGNFIQPLSQCYVGVPDRQGLVIGFGRLPTEEARPRLAAVAALLRG